MSRPLCCLWLTLGLGLGLIGACARASRPETVVPARASAAPAPSAAPAEPPVSMLSTAYVVGQCPDAKTMNVRAAEAAMRRMIEPCARIPGKRSDFRATLLPGGRIALASPSGDADEGLVPMCVLRRGLTHSVTLREPCAFDVHLEERPADRSTSPSSSETF